METLQRYYPTYQEFKQVLDTEMQKTVEGFVKIGFLLNYAAESNILEASGYANVNDFAKSEYGIDATQVSRFVNIYKRFGVEGEPRLQDQYSNYGVAKLGIMLTLPDYINEEISENYSKSEITAIKREVEAEEKISDIEVEIEKAEMQESVQYSLPEGLKQAVYQLIHDYPKDYVRCYSCIELDDFKEVMAPLGENTYFVRIKGIGRLAVFVRAETNITITNLRKGTKESYDWQQLYSCFKEYFGTGTDAKDSWCNVFQEPWPLEEKKTVGNTEKPHKDKVQQAKPKRESKVKTPEPRNVIKTEETVSKSLENITESAENVSKEAESVSEQLPGQDNIMNHPEYLSDDMKEDKQEVLTGEVEDIKEPANPDEDNVQQAHEGMKVEHFAPVQQNDAGTIRANKAIIRTELCIALDKCEKDDWTAVYVKATDIVMRARENMELEGKN